MSYTSDQWRSAVFKLLKLTSKQEINWSPSTIFQGDAWTLVDRSFQATFQDKTYVVSATRTKYFIDEEEWIWSGGFDLSIFEKVSGSYERITSSPEISLVSNLFSAAEASYAFKRGALSGLIDD
ncbi:hypothetical protein [Pseudotabrizicola alkalilacus]|uniref:hypothetical protein n=1 Tax=Pseudotabrizicola alkalilacus TaxID=2305252 RepID=UPI0011C1A593|nr:hypothetical protein [Pseudotabrizicola alkalilacus]